jgi:hypothetical protein
MAFAAPHAPLEPDRRLNLRYPIAIPLKYKLLRSGKVVKTGQGQTLNLSSSGVLMECDVALPKGAVVELSLAWPARIDGKVGLSLVATGTTLRTTARGTAVVLSQHHFRTRSLRVCAPSTIAMNSNAMK